MFVQLKLSSHFLDLLGLLLERCCQRLNLPLQLLDDLPLFQQLFHRERMARTSYAELTIRIYDNGVTGDCYTRNTGDKARRYKIRVANADVPAFVAEGVTGSCTDVDVIGAVGDVLSCLIPDDRVEGAAYAVKQRRITNGDVRGAVRVGRQRAESHRLVE